MYNILCAVYCVFIMLVTTVFHSFPLPLSSSLTISPNFLPPSPSPPTSLLPTLTAFTLTYNTPFNGCHCCVC